MKKYVFATGIILTCMLSSIMAQTKNPDWPGLNHFRADNAKLSQPAPGENRVVFMGNSITESWSDIDPAFFKGKPYINRGISGQTSPQMLIRFRPDVIELKPAVVLILAGINDIAGNTGPSTIEMIEDNIISMAELATANGIVPVLCSVLPAYDFPWSPGLKPAPKVVALNKLIKTYAQSHNIIYLDYFSPMVDDRNGLKAALCSDGVHPNLDGFHVMEPLAEEAIARALQNR
jgi:lysophospholipase L1-like esterase